MIDCNMWCSRYIFHMIAILLLLFGGYCLADTGKFEIWKYESSLDECILYETSILSISGNKSHCHESEQFSAIAKQINRNSFRPRRYIVLSIFTTPHFSKSAER